jgi:hypothetical protein
LDRRLLETRLLETRLEPRRIEIDRHWTASICAECAPAFCRFRGWDGSNRFGGFARHVARAPRLVFLALQRAGETPAIRGRQSRSSPAFRRSWRSRSSRT